MANTIKLKRGSGSDPGASDLSVGEVAVRTDTGKLFTKKDDNSVTEIGVTAVADGSITSAKIADGAIVNADVNASAAIAGSKISPQFGSQDITATGNLSLSSGDITITSLAPTINLTDSNANDDFKIEVNSGSFKIIDATDSNDRFAIDSSGNITVSGTVDGRDLATDGTKLDGIESGATGDQTASEILTALLTVDGTTSGIVATSAGKVDVSGVTTDSALQVLFSTDSGGSAKTIAVDSTSSKFTYNPSSNTLNVDTVVGNLTGNVTGNTSGSSGSCTGNAATATALETARTIAGVSFDGTANISLNNNAITNGAGYITATLTNEQVQDIVGGMVSGNTESGITVTYQDSDGTLDFSVASQTDNNFTTTLKNKLDGIASGATNVTNTNQLTNGAGFITATLTNEQVQDIVGGMVSGNTESGITVTYQDSDGTLDFSVASQTDNNFTDSDHSKLDGIEAGATADQTASEILTLIKTVDGAGSGLAADVVDGLHASSFIRSDAADTASSEITFNGGISIDGKAAANVASLTDGSTITVNMNSGTHHAVTLGGNRTFGQPSNQNVGQSGSIFITQDGTGSRTASFNSAFKFVGGTAPTLSTSANAVDRIDYVIKSSNVIHCAISLDVK